MSNKKNYQINFSFKEKVLVFGFWLEKDVLKWKLTIKGRENQTSTIDMLELFKGDEKILREKVETVLSYIKTKPEYRIKLALREIRIEEKEDFFNTKKESR
jgi:hypothetical protein